jgi:DNA polymerase
MNKELLLKWYKAFGIEHVFYPAEPVYTVRSIENPAFSSIEELKQAILSLDCSLRKTAKNTVFSDGYPEADIMIIGEAPGKEEDEQGKPFVGQSGKLLDSMLQAIDIKRSDVYISNIIFWRPPGNRTPSAEEISLCLPYVKAHITLANPKILLLLGGVAVKAILNSNGSITSLRGKINKLYNIDTIATFHPAYLLRSPAQKATAFRDFIQLKAHLERCVKSKQQPV